jgi:hypothetical protein
MTFDKARFDALARGAADANPIGFVAIQVSDLRWLLSLVTESPSQRDSIPPQASSETFPVQDFDESISPNTEKTDDGQHE